MRCGAGVFAATRLLRRLLMPSYQFASEKPVCGVCGDDKDSDLLPLPGGLRWREKPKTALTAARGFCKLRRSWSKVRFRSETKPGRRRSAPGPENQIPIPHSPIRRKLPQLLAGSSAVLDCGNGFRCGRFRAAAIREEGKRDCVESRHQPRRLSWPAAPKLIPPSSPTPRSIP